MARVYSVIERTFQSRRPYSAATAITEPPVHATGEKGLQAGALIIVGRRVLCRVADRVRAGEELGLIVIGGARDGMFGGHVIGSVAGAPLHRSPIRPRGWKSPSTCPATGRTRRMPRLR
jgi:hypothetical protein